MSFLKRGSRLRAVALALLLGGMLFSCSSIGVNNDYDPSFDFSGLERYAWLRDSPRRKETSLADSSLQANRVRVAVEEILLARGIREVPRAEADFFVAQYMNIEKRFRLDRYSYGHGYGDRPWEGRGGFYETTSLRQYDEGTLVIDFIDPQEEALIWRGTGQSRVQHTTTPEQREVLIRKAVDEILAQYPPPSP